MKFITGLSNVLFTEKGCTITIKLPKDQTDEHRDFLRSIHGGKVDIQESQGLLRPMRSSECEVMRDVYYRIKGMLESAEAELRDDAEVEDGPKELRGAKDYLVDEEGD